MILQIKWWRLLVANRVIVSLFLMLHIGFCFRWYALLLAWHFGGASNPKIRKFDRTVFALSFVWVICDVLEFGTLDALRILQGVTFEISILIFWINNQVRQFVLETRILPIALWWIEVGILSQLFLFLFNLHIEELLDKHLLVWVALFVQVLHDLGFVLPQLLDWEVLR